MGSPRDEFHPGAEDRDGIIPGRTHFCSKSCKQSKVLPLHQEPGKTRVLPWSKPG